MRTVHAGTRALPTGSRFSDGHRLKISTDHPAFRGRRIAGEIHLPGAKRQLPEFATRVRDHPADPRDGMIDLRVGNRGLRVERSRSRVLSIDLRGGKIDRLVADIGPPERARASRTSKKGRDEPPVRDSFAAFHFPGSAARYPLFITGQRASVRRLHEPRSSCA